MFQKLNLPISEASIHAIPQVMMLSPKDVASLLLWVNSGTWLGDFDRLPKLTSAAMGGVVYCQAWMLLYKKMICLHNLFPDGSGNRLITSEYATLRLVETEMKERIAAESNALAGNTGDGSGTGGPPLSDSLKGSQSGPSAGDNDEDIEMSAVGSADMTDLLHHLEEAKNAVENNLVALEEAEQAEDAVLTQLKSGIQEYRAAVTRHLLAVHCAVKGKTCTT
ncbi:hypothetical protein PILCRDRAFT_7985 [Piloderma croceum F 1598]|uniref:Uncharacterized protein n=1 Tax=Piloderma croceum (strain F 1598) TaxID=765440 RepID=A0A0C3BZ62_PILCF|nr:hypothetical protein PILCRDRAFT_7985 [Piloderma croceum F 1598]